MDCYDFSQKDRMIDAVEKFNVHLTRPLLHIVWTDAWCVVVNSKGIILYSQYFLVKFVRKFLCLNSD